jgi:hypothetical protein
MATIDANFLSISFHASISNHLLSAACQHLVRVFTYRKKTHRREKGDALLEVPIVSRSQLLTLRAGRLWYRFPSQNCPLKPEFAFEAAAYATHHVLTK